MKVGDLVREIGMSDVGLVVGFSTSPIHSGVYWRVLFGGETFDLRENDLEVINESR